MRQEMRDAAVDGFTGSFRLAGALIFSLCAALYAVLTAFALHRKLRTAGVVSDDSTPR